MIASFIRAQAGLPKVRWVLVWKSRVSATAYKKCSLAINDYLSIAEKAVLATLVASDYGSGDAAFFSTRHLAADLICGVINQAPGCGAN